MSAPHDHHEAHRPVSFYLAIAVFLTVITAFELGPLFNLYRLPPLALLGLSAIKFFAVVAFFMHLWDDAPVFTRLFAAPLVGAALMVGVLMLLHHTFAPARAHDPLPVQERYADAWNGPCSSWLRSHASNRWYCSSPAVDSGRVLTHIAAVQGGGGAEATVAPAGFDTMSDADKLAALVQHGEETYGAVCAACHQANGEGVANVFPPLKGSGEFYGDAKHHAGIIIKGLSGTIEVQGQTYNGTMPPQGALSDWDIAAVATYERNSWGNADGMVLPADVAAAR
jgi:mono/diheme cytochrome c family protein